MRVVAAEPGLSSVERQVTFGTTVILRGKPERLTSSLYAINWFDALPAWIYHFYNFLAASRLAKIGGRVFFKGHVTKTLSGDESLTRQHLLIVNYPSANHFLDLVSDKLFLLFSFLRMISVRRFSFVMHQRMDEQQVRPNQDESSFAVFHFDSHDALSLLQKLENAVDGFGLHVVFAGHQAVTVASQSRDGERAMSFVTQNTVLIEAESEAVLAAFFDTADFQHLASLTTKHYAAMLRRSYRI